MPHPQLDRHALAIRPLSARQNKLRVERNFVSPDQPPVRLPAATAAAVDEVAARVRYARRTHRPVILAFGAHTIKNGLAPVLIRLMERGWVTHLATNGAGIIHDWEFAFQGMSSEDVRGGVQRGEFGIWQETGFFINLAIVVGAYEGLGYGESVGRLIQQEGLEIPTEQALTREVRGSEVNGAAPDPRTPNPPPPGSLERAAAALDLVEVIRRFGLKPGWMAVPHPHKAFSAQAAAYRLGVPFTGHPMFGHDIIYNHPMNHGGAVGRTAERDFLAFAHAVTQLQDGVYLSVGSAVMSPMIFEKALSMAQNLGLQKGAPIDRHFIAVVDLAESRWDWQKDGEPPMDHPAYYLRYCKTFSRMGGTMRYVSSDNRDFLVALNGRLESQS